MNYFVCMFCRYKSIWEFAVKEHILIHNVLSFNQLFDCTSLLKDFKCFVCQCTAESLVQLNQHLGEQHDIESNRINAKSIITIKSSSGRQFFCSVCPYASNYRANARDHYRIRHASKDVFFECEQCPYKTTIRKYFRRHVKYTHSKPLELSKKCLYCNYESNLNSSLRKHIITKHTPFEQIDWFLCPHCPHKSKLKLCLSRHIRRMHASNQTTLKCLHCTTYETTTKENLRYHIKNMHQNANKFFQCDGCDCKYRRLSDLQQHVVKHHRKEDNLCRKCDETLRKNKRIFPKRELKFICSHCSNFKAGTHLQLKIHIIRKHTPDDEIKWLHCQFCIYKGKVKLDLLQHVKRCHPNE